ncbi:hypothetical protein IAR55_004372 [Kwoniella newhampshirensis]|uniref:Uncharacterized protein n=1 Tax=Kwoniella newhampshirensis TaxID=1651941 RepID=A0AAW0YXK7_9TREE
MPPHHPIPLHPNNVIRGNIISVRRTYIQDLSDLLHACLLRGDVERAKRAWAILIRCREVDWKSRWYWGLYLLSTDHHDRRSGLGQTHTQASTYTASADYDGHGVERWLGGLRIAAKNNEKPQFLHAVILHLIKHGRHLQALEEISTYINSYPYILSASLHTYAGLLSFYLAQPTSQRVHHISSDPNWQKEDETPKDDDRERDDSSSLGSPPRPSGTDELPNQGLMRQARGWFVKALGIDGDNEIAKAFIKLIDTPPGARTIVSDDEDEDEDEDVDEDEESADEAKYDEDEDEDEVMDNASQSKSDDGDEGQDSDKLERFDLSDEYGLDS